ncbi:hypothetical protein RFI_28885, partial [Reticulomyxa filosa]
LWFYITYIFYVVFSKYVVSSHMLSAPKLFHKQLFLFIHIILFVKPFNIKYNKFIEDQVDIGLWMRNILIVRRKRRYIKKKKEFSEIKQYLEQKKMKTFLHLFKISIGEINQFVDIYKIDYLKESKKCGDCGRSSEKEIILYCTKRLLVRSFKKEKEKGFFNIFEKFFHLFGRFNN